MTYNKKVVLFIVEGFNDQTALALPLENLIAKDNVKFEIIGGDITSDYYGKNIAAKVGDYVSTYCKKEKYQRDDFAEIVLLVDMDGAYIDDELIRKSNNHAEAYYNTDNILHKNPDQLKKTREAKRQNLARLTTLSKVYRSVPFSVYFYSCNLDHIIGNDANLAQKDKSKVAERFSGQYHNDAPGFVAFFHADDIAVGNSYNDSWTYIKQGLNSLNHTLH